MLYPHVKHIQRLLLCILLLANDSTYAQPNAPKTLTVAILIFSAEQRQAIEEIAFNFEQLHPNTNINFIFANDRSYKKNMQRWLEEPDHVDVMHWAWTAQLRENAGKGLIYPITELWQQLELNTNIANYVKPLITVDKRLYGLPYSSAVWGVYYRKSLFQQLQLKPPRHWEQLITLCKKFNNHQIPPFALGTEHHWPVGAWFDYLNLRVNGLAYHQKVMSGKETFISEKMRIVFTYWKELIDKKCFINKPHYYNEKNVLPLLYRNQAAMLLSGSFTMSQLPVEIREDFDIFSFPLMSSNIEVTEQLPTDMLIIPESSNQKELAEQFLQFLVKSKSLDLFNQRINFISPLGQVFPEQAPLLRKSVSIMTKAESFIQFYDRETVLSYTNPTVEIMARFLETSNIEATLLALEEVRLSVFRQ